MEYHANLHEYAPELGLQVQHPSRAWALGTHGLFDWECACLDGRRENLVGLEMRMGVYTCEGVERAKYQGGGRDKQRKRAQHT